MSNLPPLRSWQIEAMDSWIQHGFHGCFEVATGGGKTTFALAGYEKMAATQPALKCLIVVPTTALLDQWYVACVEDLGIEEKNVKVLNSQDLKVDAQINLIVINSARRFNNTIENPDEVLLIVDECHRSGSPENAKSLVANTLGTIGLSATPYRDFDDGFHEFVEPSLGPVLLKYTLEDAISDGVLANLSLTYAKIPLLPAEEKEYENLTKKIGRAYAANFESETIETLLRRRSRLYNNAFYRIPVMVAMMNEVRGKRTIVFLESIDSAKRAKRLLDDTGHSVCIYHSQMSTHLRRSNLRDFRKGIYDVLIACRALDEGFNVPEAEVAFIVAGTSSKRQRIQRVGRVLRSIAGKESGQVITLYATPVEEQRLLTEAKSFEQYAKTRWILATHG